MIHVKHYVEDIRAACVSRETTLTVVTVLL